MAEKRTIDINIESNADETAKDFDKVADSVGNVDKQVEDLNKNAKGGVSGFKKMGKAAKGLGMAFKAAGIGLVVAGLAALKSAFTSNQETANKFSVIMETISIVFQQTVGAIIDAVNATSKANGGFKALGKVMGGIIDLALAPFQAAFYGIKLGVLEAQLIWEQSVFGSGDVNTIWHLNKAIKATVQDLKDVGTGVLEAGGAIIDNLGAAIDEVTMLTTAAITNVKKISISAAQEQAEALVTARNAAAIAAAEQARLVEIYDRQAEQQRQIRDEERNSIAVRIKANEELRLVLEKQEKAMLAQANLQVSAAKLEYDKNKTTETRIALTEALANREGVLAQVEGLRSENLANDLALNRELIELTNLQSESESLLSIERKKADAERELQGVKLLEQKKLLLEEERKIELERLQLVIDTANEGTLARLEAEIEYNTKKQELDIEALSIDKELNDLELQNAIDLSDSKIELLEKERLAKLKNIDESLEIAQKGADAVQQLGDLVFANKMSKLEKGSKEEEELARKQFKFNKAMQLGGAIIDAGKAITASLAAAPVAFGPVPNPAGIASLAFAATTSAVNIAKIASTKFESPGGSPDAPTPDVGGGGAPNFNVVGDSGVNQLATLQQQPTQAYVVSGEVTTAQALDRNRVQNATL